MALSENRGQRAFMLCAMYFAQGVPWGFMVTALVSYLTERGITDGEAGKLTAIVLVPWTFKLFWGPIIDTITIRSMGRRRPWIIGAQLMMAVTLLGLLMMGDLTDNLPLLGWMFFLHNCFASLQDVSTDALAVDLLDRGEQGRMNGLMWGSKLIGKAFGASVMAVAIAKWGLPAAVLIQFVLLLIIMLIPIYFLERPGEKRFPWSRGQAVGVGADSSLRRPKDVIRDLVTGFSIIPTWVFFIFGTVSMIGWGIVEVITKPLYTQQLDWSFDKFSLVTGLAVATEMVGALLGGWIADRYGRNKVMYLGIGVYGLMAIVFAMLPSLWHETWFASGYILLNPGFLAMGQVGFLSMGMRISWTKASATMFTIYMTMSNVGHVFGNRLVGPLREQLELSYIQTFWFAGFVLIFPLLLLPLVRPAIVDAKGDRLKSQGDDAPKSGM